MIRTIKASLLDIAAIGLMALMLWGDNEIASNLFTFLSSALLWVGILAIVLGIKPRINVVRPAWLFNAFKAALVFSLAAYGQFGLATIHAFNWLLCAIIRERSAKATNEVSDNEQKQA